MRMLVVSEGKLDVGGDAELGPVTVLVRRMIEATLGRDLRPNEIEGEPMPRLNTVRLGKGRETRLRTALRAAEANGKDCVAFVIDRDGHANSGRRDALRAARSEIEQSGGALGALAERTAIGVAVETVEAWLLADEGALNAALAPTRPIDRHKDPEALSGGPKDPKHPKVVLSECIARATHDRDQRGHYEAIALEARLELIEERCPNGFAPFAAELRTRVR